MFWHGQLQLRSEHLLDLSNLVCPDASIWLFQFIKTMRDARGDMLRNAHLLGFFRRICRWRGQALQGAVCMRLLLLWLPHLLFASAGWCSIASGQCLSLMAPRPR